MTRVVCISDTHNRHNELVIPDGDILVHCGDATMGGKDREIASFAVWFNSLPHQIKIFVAGNHDFGFQDNRSLALSFFQDVIYLEDSEVIVNAPNPIKIYGSPWQPTFHNWAFNLNPEPLKKKWELIPSDVDILLTHSPVYGILDKTKDWDHIGCELLNEKVFEVKPIIHVFGHCHEGYGTVSRGPVTFINASSCNHSYKAVNKPIVVDIDIEKIKERR